MQIEAPLLTIAIPTYNRSRYLIRLLDSLMPQLAKASDVELLISDNASPDQTAAILEKYSREGLISRNIRNRTNLGADGNIAQCFAEAAGQYVWIIGDDDVLLPGALSVILNLLHQQEYDLVYLQAMPFTEGMQILPVASQPFTEIIGNANTFALRTHVFLTFISGNIVNKRRVTSLEHPPFSELIGTSLVQLGWIYTALGHFRKGAYIHDPLLAAGSDDRGGYALYTVFGTNLKHITTLWLGKPKLVRIILNGTLQTFFPAFVLRSKRQQGPFVEESPDDLLRALFSDNIRYYFFIYPLQMLPVQAGRLWLLICRMINRLDRSAGNPMLR